jgi:site-specific recombinase XerD
MRAVDVVNGSATAPAAPADADELAAAWLLGYADATRTAYENDLRGWSGWLQTINVETLHVHRAHVDAYVRWLEQAGRRPATIERKLASLSGFYAYAVDENLIDRSPISRVRRPKTGRDSPRLGLDQAEMRAFVAAAEAPRDRALACLLALNGLRISSVLGIDLEHLSTDRGHQTVTIVLKGGAQQLVPLAPITAEAIGAYRAGRAHGPLFVTASGRRVDRHQAAKMVARLARQARISKPVSPHTLRHSFVTAALDAGASLRDVQDAAGHADPRTTRRYDRGRHNLDRHPTYAVAAQVG